MRWRGRRQSSNIEDRRGRSGGGGFQFPGGLGRGRTGMPRGGGVRRASGGGMGLIIILVIGFFLLRSCGFLDGGGNVTTGNAPGGDVLPQTQTRDQVRTGEQPRVRETSRINPTSGGRISTEAEMREFVAVVLADAEDIWGGIFESEGQTYREPNLVLFSGNVSSACGFASSASGPFYCPGDSKLYLDMSFFQTLERQFQAQGDFAKAYVIAHEVGHHVQNLIGILPKFNAMRRSMNKQDANAMSVRVELQADCFAGIWAHYEEKKGVLHDGDIEEALNAAMQIGDDAIQKRTQGYVVPDSFNHGSSEQRREWFYEGYRSGRLSNCNTRVFG